MCVHYKRLSRHLFHVPAVSFRLLCLSFVKVDCRDLIFRAHEARDLALQRDHESRLKNVLFASEIQTLQNRCEGLEQRAAETMANMRESASLQLRELSKALRAAEDVANVAIAVARVAHKHLLALGVSTANAPTPVLTSSFRSLAPVADALNLDSSKLAHVIYNEQSKKQQLQLQGKHSILTLDPLIAKNSEGSVGNKKQNGRAEEEVANEKGNKVGTDENRIASALLLLRSSASSAASNASDSSSDNTGSTAQFNCDPFNGSLWEREEATVGAMLIEAPLRPLVKHEKPGCGKPVHALLATFFFLFLYRREFRSETPKAACTMPSFQQIPLVRQHTGEGSL